MRFLALAAVVATLVVKASAHTRVWSVWINGSDQGAGAGSYIRQPPTNSPIKDLTSSDLRCNVNGDTPVGTYVPVAAGSNVTTEWCTQILSSVDQRISFVHVSDHNTRGDDIIDASHKGPIRT
jgi:cellulase